MVTLLTEVGIRIEPTMAAHKRDATKSVTTPTANKDSAWEICFAEGDVF